MFRRYRSLSILFLLPISYFILLSACDSGGCARSGGDTASVVVEPVKVQESSPTVIIPGVLIPRDKVELKAGNTAKIAEIYVVKGDMVKQGAVIARLSEEEINLKLNQLRAAKKEAENLLEKNSYIMKNRDQLLTDGKIDKTQYDGAEIETNNNNATLSRINADIAIAEYNQAHIQITSPINGVIIEKSVSPSQTVAENTPLFTIVNTDPILVSFPLTADESGGIKLGSLINVKFDDIGDNDYTATVTYISPDIRLPSKTFDVWASIPNSDGVLKIGMQGTATFTSTNIHKVFVVPKSSIITRDRDRFVFTVSGGIAHETKVGVRNIYDDIAEVSNGLAENDLVVVKGAGALQDGVTVEMWRR